MYASDERILAEWSTLMIEVCLCAQEGKYKQAAVQYKHIVSWLEQESSLQGEEEDKAKALRLAAHLNLAMCYLKLHDPSPALENCDKVAGL